MYVDHLKWSYSMFIVFETKNYLVLLHRFMNFILYNSHNDFCLALKYNIDIFKHVSKFVWKY